MPKKKTTKGSISIFKWQPDGAITWVLDEPREKFDRKVILMPLSVLIEEYGYLREAQGCLIMQYKGETSKDYFNDPRSKELRERVDMVEDQIQKRYYDQVDAMDRMDYYSMIEHFEKEQK
jgi:hypothetical protein